MGRHGGYASTTSLSGFAIRALTTCLAGISTRAPVAGFRPKRFSRCGTTSFAIHGSMNSPHRNSSCSVSLLYTNPRAAAPHALAALWLVDPGERTLEAFELTAGAWTRIATADDDELVRIAPFEAAGFNLADLWP